MSSAIEETALWSRVIEGICHFRAELLRKQAFWSRVIGGIRILEQSYWGNRHSGFELLKEFTFWSRVIEETGISEQSYWRNWHFGAELLRELAFRSRVGTITIVSLVQLLFHIYRVVCIYPQSSINCSTHFLALPTLYIPSFFQWKTSLSHHPSAVTCDPR